MIGTIAAILTTISFLCSFEDTMRNQLTVSWFFVCKNIKNIPSL